MIQNKMDKLIKAGKEKVLLVRVKRKDKSAFVEAYDNHVDQIYRFIYFKVSDQDDANDLTSQVFLKAWNYIQETGIKDVSSLRALFYKIARNTIIDFYRSRAKSLSISIEGLEDVIADHRDFAEDYENRDDFNRVVDKMLKLKNEYREILIFFYVEELSIKEIAKILNKNNGNVRVLLHRALKTLKQMLNERQ